MEYAEDQFLFPLVTEPRSRWEKAGLSPRQERSFNRVSTLLVALFVTGWLYSIFLAPPEDLEAGRPPVARISAELVRSPLATDAPTTAAFLTDGMVRAFASDFAREAGMASGAVRVKVLRPGERLDVPGVPAGASVELKPSEGGQSVAAGEASNPGIWNVVLKMADAIRPAMGVSVITLVPLSAKKSGRIGGYSIGSWPYEGGGAPKPIYEPPAGLVKVTPENMNLYVSEHVQLRDFLTKGQEGVWPKYVALQPKVLDKVELTIQELKRSGHPVKDIFVVSGFRTPSYNVDGGDPSGRAALSRHMYGDAMDIAVDNDGDGRMDDLNGDGRVTVEDARVLGEAADRVEQAHPELVGGIGIYAPTGAHSGFVHIDTRGYRARW
ncbi:MAG TPA: hypothetical protein VGO40_00575 [Longimicrobium sp.]|jgi:hypothetical protein|nr:hypothetical protein [Longimicrobium sp.]